MSLCLIFLESLCAASGYFPSKLSKKNKTYSQVWKTGLEVRDGLPCRTTLIILSTFPLKLHVENWSCGETWCMFLSPLPASLFSTVILTEMFEVQMLWMKERNGKERKLTNGIIRHIMLTYPEVILDIRKNCGVLFNVFLNIYIIRLCKRCGEGGSALWEAAPVNQLIRIKCKLSQ